MTPESSDSNSSLDFLQFIGRALTRFAFFGEPSCRIVCPIRATGIRLRDEPDAMIPRPHARVITVTARGLFKVAAIAAAIAQIAVQTADKNVATTPHARLKIPRGGARQYKRKPADD